MHAKFISVLLVLICIFVDVLVESSVWNGINVSPLETCYEKPPEKKEDDECTEDMESENAYEEMETAENA